MKVKQIEIILYTHMIVNARGFVDFITNTYNKVNTPPWQQTCKQFEFNKNYKSYHLYIIVYLNSIFTRASASEGATLQEIERGVELWSVF